VTNENEDFSQKVHRAGYPDVQCPPEFIRQWMEGEQASFNESPDACPYRLDSDAAYWWQMGFDAAEAVTATLNESLGDS